MISKAQFGRSMTETLMVLAIVGILSIAVCLGIHYGLTKADAVNLTEDANRRLWVVKTIPLPTHGNITISEFNATTRKGYPITQGFDENLRSFVMVSAVPFKICQMVQSVIGDNTSLALTINPESESKLCMEDEENVLVFGEGTGSAAPVEPAEPDEQGEEPEQGCTSNSDCANPTPICNIATGVCEPGNDCVADADCLAYAPDTPVCGADGHCVSCADKNGPTSIWHEAQGCISCPTDGGWLKTTNQGLVEACVSTCNDNGYHTWKGGSSGNENWYCYDCATSYNGAKSATDAQTCVNYCRSQGFARFAIGAACRLCPVNDDDWDSGGSTNTYSTYVDNCVSSCNAANNPVWKGRNGNYKCHSCNSTSDNFASTTALADKCASDCTARGVNRTSMGVFCLKGTLDTLCPKNGGYRWFGGDNGSAAASSCVSKCNAAGYPTWRGVDSSSHQTCYSCDATETTAGSESLANKCASDCTERGVNRIAIYNLCYKKTIDEFCPKGTTYWQFGDTYNNTNFYQAAACVSKCNAAGYPTWQGVHASNNSLKKCYSCDATETTAGSESLANKCASDCTEGGVNRIAIYNLCYKKTIDEFCPKGTTYWQFGDTYNNTNFYQAAACVSKCNAVGYPTWQGVHASNNSLKRCYSCDATETTAGSESLATACANNCRTSGTPRYASGTNCRKCSSLNGNYSSLTQTQCDQCNGVWNGTVCSPPPDVM